jgi:hypothetical protein
VSATGRSATLEIVEAVSAGTRSERAEGFEPVETPVSADAPGAGMTREPGFDVPESTEGEGAV